MQQMHKPPVQQAVQKAEQELAAARAELEALLSAGDKTNADALTTAVEELNDAILSAKTVASGADTALKSELTDAIAAAVQEAIDA